MSTIFFIDLFSMTVTAILSAILAILMLHQYLISKIMITLKDCIVQVLGFDTQIKVTRFSLGSKSQLITYGS